MVDKKDMIDEKEYDAMAKILLIEDWWGSKWAKDLAWIFTLMLKMRLTTDIESKNLKKNDEIVSLANKESELLYLFCKTK